MINIMAETITRSEPRAIESNHEKEGVTVLHVAIESIVLHSKSSNISCHQRNQQIVTWKNSAVLLGWRPEDEHIIIIILQNRVTSWPKADIIDISS